MVQVTAEQAQIPEEGATKARDPNPSDHDQEEVALKAHDPDSDDRDLEEIMTKSRNPNSIQRHEHERARVLAVVHLFVAAVIARKTVVVIRTKSVVKS